MKTKVFKFFLSLIIFILVIGMYNPSHGVAVGYASSIKQDRNPPPEKGELFSQEIIEVKFKDGTSYRVRDGEMVTQATDDLTGIAEVLSNHPVQSIDRLFSQSEESLAQDLASVRASTKTDLPDLNLWFRMKVAEGTDIDALVEALNALPEVESAYRSPLPAPPPGLPVYSPNPAPAPPDLTSEQTYLNAAPAGIDAYHAWTLPGGTGSNVTIVDIEYGYHTTHVDLPTVTLIGGALYTHSSDPNDDHGTAVLGELGSKNNTYGTTGIAYGAALEFSSPCNDASCTTFNLPDAINTARLSTSPGDVILIEQQTPVCGTGNYGPVEYWAAEYNAIVLATLEGRIVVEAAGNGDVDLDQPACGGFFDRTIWDSGAIIVGAGASPDSAPSCGWDQIDRSRLPFSSYGSRVDVQGYGDCVVTTGYKDLYEGTGQDQWYTFTFSGTSSASPIVAGAAALLSSIYAESGIALDSFRARDILTLTGRPQRPDTLAPLSEHIGPRPDLFSALGYDKVGHYDPVTSRWFLKPDNVDGGVGVNKFYYGPAGGGRIPISGDWDGDGYDTVGLYDPSNSRWFLKPDNVDGGAGVIKFYYGPAGGGRLPIVGDWDGDGIDEIGLYDPATSRWFLKDENTTGASGVTKFYYGPAGGGRIPIAGDWDGDGTDTVGLYDPGLSKWFLKDGNVQGGGVTRFLYGPAGGGRLPISGDWDEDGVDTIGMYDPATSRWFLKPENVTGGVGVVKFYYGPAGGGRLPITGDWD